MNTDTKQSKHIRLIADIAIHQLDESIVSVEHLATGSTSKVFGVTTSASKYVLKVEKPGRRKCTSYRSDFAIRRALDDANLPVAEPIATGRDEQTDWALDRYCAGGHPARGAIPPAVSRQLGELLKALHAMPASGFGRVENTEHYLKGRFDSPINGLLSRFESPWPFSDEPLDRHPCIRAAPSLLQRLSSLETTLTTFAYGGAPVVVHSDLHEAQLQINDHTLTAVFDFNEAMVGRPEWDLASFYYFHGLACLQDLLDGYADDSDARRQLAATALHGGILIALHHGNRGKVLGKPHRIAAALRFLTHNLPTM